MVVREPTVPRTPPLLGYLKGGGKGNLVFPLKGGGKGNLVFPLKGGGKGNLGFPLREGFGEP